MREMMLVFAVIILSVCETWSLDTGPPQSTSLMSNTSSATKVHVVRNASFNPGSDVHLTCGNKLWSEIIFLTWNIDLTNIQCTIAHSSDGQSTDTCNDGKSLQKTSTGQPYLHISHFSNKDVGVYHCQTVYVGGFDAHMINVNITVVRNAFFNLGSNVHLTCGNKLWSEISFLTWNIDLTNIQCTIAHSSDGQSTDTCNDGKSLQNTSTGQPYLHISHFSNHDVGVYRCETVYVGGVDAHMINVNITVPPNISAWLEWKDNRIVAVCKAERGKPAANISWSHIDNSSSFENWSGSDGLFTVESHLELPANMDTKNLSCTIRHPYWEEERTLVIKPLKALTGVSHTAPDHFIMMCIRIVVIIIAVLAGILFFAKKKLTCCGVADRQTHHHPNLHW